MPGSCARGADTGAGAFSCVLRGGASFPDTAEGFPLPVRGRARRSLLLISVLFLRRDAREGRQSSAEGGQAFPGARSERRVSGGLVPGGEFRGMARRVFPKVRQSARARVGKGAVAGFPGRLSAAVRAGVGPDSAEREQSRPARAAGAAGTQPVPEAGRPRLPEAARASAVYSFSASGRRAARVRSTVCFELFA